MELVTHYSRSFRRAYERSISEQKFENNPQINEFFKGENLRKENISCYQGEKNIY
jgi:hypothetical protein